MVKVSGKLPFVVISPSLIVDCSAPTPHCSVQWGTGSCNTVRTLPLALSTFKVAFAMHQGTVTNTVIISSQDYASSLTQVKFLTNNSNDTAFVMYIVIGR